MPGKIVEISCKSGHLDTLTSLAETLSLRILSQGSGSPENDRLSIRYFVKQESVQSVLDKLQSMLPVESEPLILLVPVDAKIGLENEIIEPQTDTGLATREELFNEISKGTECDRTFVLLTLLATMVAAIGIAEDNVAVVIGAMVIAPLLGPNLGLAFGSALGDKELIKTAIFTNAVGVGLTIGLSIILGLIWPPNLESNELISRTHVDPAAVVLALASGIAAAVSLTTRLENILVGVMVAVALVPPATVLGMMIGIQQWDYASNAALLLTINITAVNLAAQIVFVVRGIRPRTWLAQREAKESTWINTIVWAILLLICFALLTTLSN